MQLIPRRRDDEKLNPELVVRSHVLTVALLFVFGDKEDEQHEERFWCVETYGIYPSVDRSNREENRKSIWWIDKRERLHLRGMTRFFRMVREAPRYAASFRSSDRIHTYAAASLYSGSLSLGPLTPGLYLSLPFSVAYVIRGTTWKYDVARSESSSYHSIKKVGYTPVQYSYKWQMFS